jgi:transcriptional regulator with XRE-family HTH domain
MRWAREQRHFTLEQVAEFLGLEGHASVRNWEAGKNFPELANLVPVAGLYSVSIDWLVSGGDVGGIDERVRRIPAIFRSGLIDRLHREIDETEAAVKKLPKEMAGDPVKDADERLKGWSAANLNKKHRAKPKGGTQ